MSRPSDPNARIDLLRAAEATFVEHGLDQAKVEDIASRAGHSKGAFYLHFKNKDDAFRQIVDGVLARLADCIEMDEQKMRQMLALPPGELLAMGRAKDAAMFDFIWQNRRVMRLMLQGGRSASYSYFIDAFAERSALDTERVMRGAQAVGLFRADVDVRLAAQVMAGAYDRVAREVVKLDERPDLEALALGLQRALLGGLAGPATASTLREEAIVDARVSNRSLGKSTARKPSIAKSTGSHTTAPKSTRASRSR